MDERGQQDGPGERAGALPDLTGLALADLRDVRHPVLDQVLADLRERAARPDELLWGYNSAL
ncbi:hypothetical protein DSC45_15590 [Streptomyces sp. YIM 130001]|uniref:FxSxx-COOH cyclophane-containing RiPP peptide n=1 Tax=Streptomyces sp. YIM 130001 TaxID=2259644 RepID=UPI000E64F640|nr:FxSxx-COOH cyclophane-containing RiPP peptide [Streptomyces sp. YIM 130001]RII16009.1 hypothetical protein DSC45_15590 [Streptomyces sp. YIM 130001]